MRADDHTFAICAYKESPYLEEAVRSVAEQKVFGKALISTATPNTHIESIAKRYGFPVVHNTGLSTASGNWNFGYDASETPYVTIVHQDDVYDDEYLKSVIDAVNRYPREDISLVFTDYYEIRGNEKVYENALLNVKRIINAPLRVKALNSSRFVRRRTLAFGDSICCPSVTLHKPIVGESPFDTTMVSSYDYKTWVDIASRDGRFVYVPKTLVGHRIHDESGTTENIHSNARRNDDREIMLTLWPRPLGVLMSKLYSKAEDSNNL